MIEFLPSTDLTKQILLKRRTVLLQTIVSEELTKRSNNGNETYSV
jgi:hypothetical protein